jgi:ribosomal protein S18 acetylase RimI-like enzyme
MADGFVIEVERKVVAFMRTARDPEENRYYVSSLYVLPEFQSKGLGKLLMKRAAEEAKAFRLDRLWVGVMVQNQHTVDWYKSMGYQVVRTEPFSMGKSTVDHHIGFIINESIH